MELGMSNAITVVIPSIPPRRALLERAQASVAGAAAHLMRHYQVDTNLVVVLDTARQGAARNRHRGLLEVSTPWVAFLDDDDVMHPDHLTQLYGAALEHSADYLWSRFQIIKRHNEWRTCMLGSLGCMSGTPHRQYAGGEQHLMSWDETVPGPVFLGGKAFSQWDDNDPCQTTITTLVRTDLAVAAGGFAQFDDQGELIDGNRRGEDHEFTLNCRKAGGVFRHVERVTWDWHHHDHNTSGLPTW